ncbi:sugar transferase [Photobacterium damselae subsp. damselae]|uniref:sugar transferase n=1 Tax=Photobacterium damselae TaxID=38293 RepID=UPI001F42EF10|nr:sugar transferase [Photobacterium damselae]UJZ94138.1 sugar transferase [Photobacterium damselae subsp. damselae]UJZ98119.1 sugar transferase [Photobacterium damselae subsp. damselae]
MITLTLLLTFLIIYHHVIYSVGLLWFAKHLPHPTESTQTHLTQPTIAFVLPIHNEADYIEQKLANILMLDYPADKLSLYIFNDGSDDATLTQITHWQTKFKEQGIALHLEHEEHNSGKVVRLNSLIHLAQQSDFIAFTDASALLSIDGLQQAVMQFQSPSIGALTGNYLLQNGGTGEKQYWQWQNQLRYAESELGSVMGGNGAFYMVRSHLVETLPEDTINDDFILPMNVLKHGYKIVFNAHINTVEIAPTSQSQDYRRRQRIGAGNLQQLIRCRFILRQKNYGALWLFLSGKGLRTVMPFILIAYFFITLMLTLTGSILGSILFTGQCLGYSLALLPSLGFKNKYLIKLHYFVVSYFASLIGMLRYSVGQFKRGWRHIPPIDSYQPQITSGCKRLCDIVLSLLGLGLTLPFWPLIALAIKFNSKGPVFYRQLRVGKIEQETVDLFEIIKFRTMYHSEKNQADLSWAKKADPRVTSVGRFLRDTRIDEIPQFINVLRGDMSLIGPRPERPELCGSLQNALPFYLERTAGLKPGLTGLAQVNHGYDNTIEDVKEKIGWDHAYAVTLGSPWQWLKMDIYILIKTIKIMLTRKGQ